MALYNEEDHAHHRNVYIGHDPAVCALGFGSTVQWALGYPARAVRLENESITLARRLRHAPSLAHALWRVCASQAARGDVLAVKANATESLILSEEREAPNARANALIYLGYGRATKAPPDERGGNRHARPTAAAPLPHSTQLSRSRRGIANGKSGA